MPVDVKEGYGLVRSKALTPAPHGNAMVVAHMNVSLLIEEIDLLTTGAATGDERYVPLAGHVLEGRAKEFWKAMEVNKHIVPTVPI